MQTRLSEEHVCTRAGAVQLRWRCRVQAKETTII